MTANIENQQEEDLAIISCEERLKAVLDTECNQVCAECPELEPTWAFLLENPIEEDGPKLGIICCYRCYGNHMRLGVDVGQVKSTRRVGEWTEEEVQILACSGNKMVNEIYEAKCTAEDKARKKADMEAFVNNKYKDLKYFSKKTFQQYFKTTKTVSTGGGFFGTTSSKPSFDWANFSRHSKTDEDSDMDSSAHSTSSRKREPKRGLSKAFSNPFALESMRKELDSSDKSADSGEGVAPPSLMRAVSNPFATQRTEGEETSILPGFRRTLTTSKVADSAKQPGFRRTLTSKAEDSTSTALPGFRRTFSTTINRMMGTTPTADSAATEPTVESISEGDPAEEENKDSSNEDSNIFSDGEGTANSQEMGGSNKAIVETGEHEKDDLSFLATRGNRMPRRGVARARSAKTDPRSLDFLRRDAANKKETEESSQVSSLSRRRRAPGRRGVAKAQSSGLEMMRQEMRQENGNDGDDTSCQTTSSRTRRAGAPVRGVRKTNSGRSLDLLRRGTGDNTDDSSSQVPSRSRRPGGPARGVRRTNSGRTVDFMRWDLYKPDDAKNVADSKDDSAASAAPKQPRRPVSSAASSPHVLEAMRREIGIALPAAISDRSNGAGVAEDDMALSRAKRGSNRERVERRRKPSSTNDLSNLLQRDKSNEDKKWTSEHGKRKKGSSRATRTISLGDSSKGGRSIRSGSGSRSGSRSGEKRGDESTRSERSKVRKRASRSESLDKSTRSDKSPKGDRGRHKKGESDGMETSSKGGTSSRGEKSTRGERSRSRKVSPTNSDKSEKRKSSSMDKSGRKDGSRHRSPRRTTTEPRERKSPKPIRRQRSTPSGVLEEGLLISNDEEENLIFGKASTTSLLDDESSDGEDSTPDLTSLSRRRSSGRLGDSSSSAASSSRRRSSGRRRSDDTKSSRKGPSPKKSGSQSSRKSHSSLSPKRSSTSQHSRLSSGVQLFGEGVTELAQIILSGQNDSVHSTASLPAPARLAAEDMSEKRRSGHSLNSSLLDLYPDSPDSESASEVSFGLDDDPSTPTEKRDANENSIHSLRSPLNHRKDKLIIPDLEKESNNDEDENDTLGDSARGQKPESADGSREKTKPRKSSGKVKRVKTDSFLKRDKREIGESSERSHRTRDKKSRSKHTRKDSTKKPETLQDTILALQAMTKPKVSVSETTKKLALQRSVTTS